MAKLLPIFVFCAVTFVQLSVARKAAHVRVTRSIEGDLTLHVKADELQKEFQLEKSTSSVFSKGFKFATIGTNAAGQEVFKPQAVSAADLAAAESTIYVNKGENVAVHVSNVDGIDRVHGHIGEHQLTHEANEDKNQHFIDSKKADFTPSDYIDAGRVVRLTKTFRAVVSVQPELAIVFDNANYNTFKGDKNAMMRYLALMIHSVNNRYAAIPTPKIQFTVSGLLAIDTPSAEPFIRNALTPDRTAYDMNKVLDDYTLWAYTNAAKLPKHDLVPLISGVKFQSKDATGKYVDGIAGLAWLKGACWINGNKDMGTSVSADAGGVYDGVNTIAHELAHNLGSPHDGEGETASCPWADGYIMSYLGHGTAQKFLFSQCSIATMNAFITSTGGTCLKTFESSTRWEEAQTNPGDYIDMNAQCQAIVKNAQAYVDNNVDPNQLCKNLVCKYPNDSSTWTMTTYRGAYDGTLCGESGSCVQGSCVLAPSMTSQCQSATRVQTASADTTKTPDALCSNLACQYSDPANPSTIKRVAIGQPAMYHTPCGRKGRCINNACVEPPKPVIPPSMDEQCKTLIGNPSATADPTKTPDQLCSNFACRYPDTVVAGRIYTRTFGGPPPDYTPCGTNGNCLKNVCAVGVV